MVRSKGLNMPKKRRRAVAEQQTAPVAAADEADQDSALGTTSPSTCSPPLVEATEDLMADERAEANMKHDMQLEVAAESMRDQASNDPLRAQEPPRTGARRHGLSLRPRLFA